MGITTDYFNRDGDNEEESERCRRVGATQTEKEWK
jgi:hypothetical protein